MCWKLDMWSILDMCWKLDPWSILHMDPSRLIKLLHFINSSWIYSMVAQQVDTIDP
jgi:hypothetical protein